MSKQANRAQPQTNASDAALDHLVTRVTENTKSVDTLLKSFAAFAGVLVLLKLFGNHDFTWNGITFSATNDAIFVCILFTVAHWFTAYRVVRSAHALWKANDVEHGKEAFAQVTETGSLFVRELVPRVDHRKRFLVSIYKMVWSDPSAWAAYGFALLLPCAIVPFDFSNLFRFFLLFAGAICLTLFNWVVASAWMIALSELTLQPDVATYHVQLEAKHNKRQKRMSMLTDLSILVLMFLLVVCLTPLVIAGVGIVLLGPLSSFLVHFHGFVGILGRIIYALGILLICVSILLFFFLMLLISRKDVSGL